MLDRRLLSLAPPARKYIALHIVLKCLSLGASIAVVFSMGRAIETGGEFLPMLVSFMVVSILVGVLCSYFVSVTRSKSAAAVKKSLRERVYKKLLALGNSYQEKTQTAKVVQLAAEGIEQIEVYFSLYVPQLFYSLLAVATVTVVLAALNGAMALSLLACVPLIPISIAVVQRIGKRILGVYWGKYANLADTFLENLQGLTTLKIYGADEHRQVLMDRETEGFRRVTMRLLSMQLNSVVVMDTVAFSGASLGIVMALLAYRAGSLSLAECFVSVLLAADFFIPLRTLGSFFHTAMNGAAASKNIFALLDIEEGAAGTRGLEARGAMAFQSKGLSYEFGERQVLYSASISIPAGSFVAFVGESGSGKSTVAKIICGINREYEGEATLFGVAVGEIDPLVLNRTCVYISHADWIFKGTVGDTLREGKAQAGEEELWQVLEQVRLADFVKDNGGLDMAILENAANLSGGQKQRLSIARALLHNPHVFIFDEATSNIDVESEAAILQLLHRLKGRKTVVMISHRSENSAGADKIYHFDHGQVQERAKPQEQGAAP